MEILVSSRNRTLSSVKHHASHPLFTVPRQSTVGPTMDSVRHRMGLVNPLEKCLMISLQISEFAKTVRTCTVMMEGDNPCAQKAALDPRRSDLNER